MKKWWIYLLAIALPIHYAFYHQNVRRAPGFSIDKITPFEHAYNPDFHIPYSDTETQQVKDILKRPFSYFGSGRTCYAFLSDDGTYVLKLFKQRRMRPFSRFEKILGYGLIPHCQKKLQQRLSNRNKLFTSFKIAHHDLKEETALIYLHLQPSNHLKQPLFLTSKDGQPFTLDADSMEFLIQKRAERTFPALTNMIETGQIEAAQNAIDSIVELITTRCQKQIDDDDNNCERNIGLLDGKAIEIDIGEFTYNPQISSSDVKQHVQTATEDLYTFLKTHYPNFYESIQNTR